MTDRSLRPMALGDIFDEGFDLYKKNLSLLMLTAAVVILPLTVGETAYSGHWATDVNAIAAAFNNDGSYVDAISGIGLVAIGCSVLYAVMFCALTVCASNRYLGQAVTLARAYRVPLYRFPTLIATMVLYLLALPLGCGVITVIAFLFTGLFTAHAFSLEGKRFIGPWRRSAQLSSDSVGTIIGCLLLLVILTVMINAGFYYPIDYLSQTLLKLVPSGQTILSTVMVGSTAWRQNIATYVASGITDLIVAPFVVCVLTVLYYDLRVRKEAFDITLLAQSLGYPPLIPGGDYLPPAVVPTSGALPQYASQRIVHASHPRGRGAGGKR
jgi:hypothetical protein